jgi:KDO2-lipid IV(A) lauroyltransferase
MLFRLISWLPLPVLYGLCGALAWILRVVRWRRPLVDDALRRCLPGKTAAERSRIARDFYAGVGELVAEILRGGRLSTEELERRLRFENDAVVRDALAQGRRVLLVAGHHCNWEWLLLEVSRRFGVPLTAPYKRISLASADRWARATRSRFGATMVPSRDIGAYLVANRRRVRLLAMLADQSPSRSSEDQVWLPFFGQDTAFFQGPGWIGERLRFEPVFIAMRPEGKGRYVARFVPLGAPGERMDANQVLRAYVGALEEAIGAHPARYFWAYNRWKGPRRVDG